MKTIAIAAGLLLAAGILIPISGQASSTDERAAQAADGAGQVSATPAEVKKAYSVKGQVIHAEDGSPAAYVTIAIFNTDKEMVAGTSTDENGHFETGIKKTGKYTAHFTSVGKTELKIEFAISTSERIADIGVIEMADGAETLSELVFVEQKQIITNEIDKLVYSVSDDVDAKTSNALDILRKVPRVTVDGDDAIRINGNTNFSIYVNGKPSKMFENQPGKLLKSLPAESIRKMEIISNPGAKYDAEGMGGILNIVMNNSSDTDGFSFNLHGNRSNKGQSFGAYTTARIGKFSISANYMYNRFNNKGVKQQSERINLTDENKYRLITDNVMNQKMQMHTASLETSYDIDTLNMITMSGTFNSYGFGLDNRNLVNMFTKDLIPVYSYGQRISGDGNICSGSANVNYQHISKRNSNSIFTLSYMFNANPSVSDNFYEIYDRTGDDPYVNALAANRRQYNKAATWEHIVQADYTTKFNGMHGLETGVKYILRDNTSQGTWSIKDGSGDWIPDTGTEKTDYLHRMNIAAAYAAYSVSLGQFGIKAGIRDEFTWQNVKYNNNGAMDFSTSFNDLVPSLTLSWQPSMFKSLNLSYNMRISRPGIHYLNPFRKESVAGEVTYGNPDIVSEKSHNISLEFSSFSAKFNINAALGYTFMNNSIASYMFIDEDGIINNTYDNLGRNHSIGLSLFANWNPNKNIRLYANGDLRYVTYSSTDNGNIHVAGLRNSGLTGSIFAGAQYSFWKGCRIGANGGYFAPSVSLLGSGFGGYFYSLNLGKSFLDDRLNIDLNLSNFAEDFIIYKNTERTGSLISSNTMHYPARMLVVNISYRIGNFKGGVNRVRKSIVNDSFKDKGENGMQNMPGQKN